MTYEEWLITIENLKNTNINQELLDKIKNTDINENINNMLIPKITSMLKYRFDESVNKITRDIYQIFSDHNYLDLALLNFKKELKYLIELTNIKQLPNDIKEQLINKFKTDTEKVYNILLNKANTEDYTGILSMTINNNRIKWSE